MKEKVCRLMADRIRELFEKKDASKPSISRIGFEVGPVNILSWLKAQSGKKASLYWESRDGSFEVGGIGTAMTLTDKSGSDTSLDRLKKSLQSSVLDGESRFYGGMRFQR